MSYSYLHISRAPHAQYCNTTDSITLFKSVFIKAILVIQHFGNCVKLGVHFFVFCFFFCCCCYCLHDRIGLERGVVAMEGSWRPGHVKPRETLDFRKGDAKTMRRGLGMMLKHEPLKAETALEGSRIPQTWNIIQWDCLQRESSDNSRIQQGLQERK